MVESSELEMGHFETEDISFASGAGISIAAAFILGPIGLILGPLAGMFGLTKKFAIWMKLGTVRQSLLKVLEEGANKMSQEIEKNINAQMHQIREQLIENLNQSIRALHGGDPLWMMEVVRELQRSVMSATKEPSVAEIIFNRNLIIHHQID